MDLSEENPGPLDATGLVAQVHDVTDGTLSQAGLARALLEHCLLGGARVTLFDLLVFA
jgi:hypothetical protein